MPRGSDGASAQQAAALAAVGVLAAAGAVTNPGTPDAAGLALRLTELASVPGPLRWTAASEEQVLAAAAGATAGVLADAWSRFRAARSGPLALDLDVPQLGGGAHLRLVRLLARPSVGAQGVAGRLPGTPSRPSPGSPLRLGVLKDAHLFGRLAEGVSGVVGLEVLHVTQDTTACDVLVLPQPPPRPAVALSQGPVALASAIVVLDDPRAPIELTADFLWEAFRAAPCSVAVLAPMNGRETADWASRFAAALARRETLAAAFCGAQPPLGEACLVLSRGGRAFDVPSTP